jgi:hypothetical protein
MDILQMLDVTHMQEAAMTAHTCGAQHNSKLDG